MFLREKVYSLAISTQRSAPRSRLRLPARAKCPVTQKVHPRLRLVPQRLTRIPEKKKEGGKVKILFFFAPRGDGCSIRGKKMMNLIAGKDDFREITMGGRIFWLLRTCLVTRGGGTLYRFFLRGRNGEGIRNRGLPEVE